MAPGRLVAVMHHYGERQPQPRDAEREVAVRQTSELVRVVSELGALLVSVQGLDRRVEVRDVFLREDALEEPQVLAPHPRQRLALRHGREIPPHRVVRHEPPHAEERSRGRVAVEPV